MPVPGGGFLSPQNVELGKETVLLERHILWIVFGFIKRLFKGNHVERNDFGSPDQLVASVCAEYERNVPSSVG